LLVERLYFGQSLLLALLCSVLLQLGQQMLDDSVCVGPSSLFCLLSLFCLHYSEESFPLFAMVNGMISKYYVNCDIKHLQRQTRCWFSSASSARRHWYFWIFFFWWITYYCYGKSIGCITLNQNREAVWRKKKKRKKKKGKKAL
jgi:hypothetical protein